MKKLCSSLKKSLDVSNSQIEKKIKKWAKEGHAHIVENNRDLIADVKCSDKRGNMVSRRVIFDRKSKSLAVFK